MAGGAADHPRKFTGNENMVNRARCSPDTGRRGWADTTGINVTGTATLDGLTVDGTSNLNGVAQVGGSTDLLYLSGKTGTHAYMSLGGSSTAADFFIGADTAIPLIFRTNATERMRIDASGSVGIGTSSPSYKADILATNQYAMRLNTTDADGCFLAIQTNGTAKGYLGTSHHLATNSPSENDKH